MSGLSEKLNCFGTFGMFFRQVNLKRTFNNLMAHVRDLLGYLANYSKRNGIPLALDQAALDSALSLCSGLGE